MSGQVLALHRGVRRVSVVLLLVLAVLVPLTTAAVTSAVAATATASSASSQLALHRSAVHLSEGGSAVLVGHLSDDDGAPLAGQVVHLAAHREGRRTGSGCSP